MLIIGRRPTVVKPLFRIPHYPYPVMILDCKAMMKLKFPAFFGEMDYQIIYTILLLIDME